MSLGDEAAAILDEERGAVLVSALLDATNLLLAGKTVVVGRYDALGRGAARRARGFGARVIVVERRVRPAYDAWRDGHDLAPAAEACRAAEIVLLPEGLPLGELPAGAIVGAGDPASLGLAGEPVRGQVEAVELANGRRIDVVDLSGAALPRELLELAEAFETLPLEDALRLRLEQRGVRLEPAPPGA